MNFVLCEWICTRCGNLHKTGFKIMAKKISGDLLEDCIIQDYPVDQQNSVIHVKWNMALKDVFAALKDHVICFYSMEPESLTMEVCRE